MTKEDLITLRNANPEVRKATNLLLLCLLVAPLGVVLSLITGGLAYFFFESTTMKNLFYFLCFMSLGLTYSMITGLSQAKIMLKKALQKI